MADDCIFCKIANSEIPAKIVFRTDTLLAIEDLNPQAPTHLLVLPIKHYETLADATAVAGHDNIAAELIQVATRLGNERGGAKGYRLVVNTGPYGGQTVGHLHVHVLGGRRMTWPPG